MVEIHGIEVSAQNLVRIKEFGSDQIWYGIVEGIQNDYLRGERVVSLDLVTDDGSKRSFREEQIEIIRRVGGVSHSRKPLVKEAFEDTNVTISINLNADFDGIDLEEAIESSTGKAKKILQIVHDKWVNEIGQPGWSQLRKQ